MNLTTAHPRRHPTWPPPWLPPAAAQAWRLAPEEQLLCAVMQVADVTWQQNAAQALLHQCGSSNAFTLAAAHELQGHVAHALGEQATAEWRSAHRETERRISGFLEELDRLAEIFWEDGIPLVALKNAGIARALHPCRGCCPMGDLDLLVHRADFLAAHRILLQQGYQFAFRSPQEKDDLKAAEKGGGAEYSIQLASGDRLWLELQWRPIAGRWIRPDQEPDGGALMKRSCEVAGTRVRILAPEDNLLQVALHTAKHSYVRAPGLRLHTDVDRIVQLQPSLCGQLDWDKFVSLVRQAGVRTAAYFSLKIPHDLLGTSIPGDVLHDLQPGIGKRSFLQWQIGRAGLASPAERKFGRWGYLLFNLLLYDDLAGMFRAAFPPRHWMRDHYGVTAAGPLCYWYARRLWDLICRRNPT